MPADAALAPTLRDRPTDLGALDGAASNAPADSAALGASAGALPTSRLRAALAALHPSRWGFLLPVLLMAGLWLVDIAGSAHPSPSLLIEQADWLRGNGAEPASLVALPHRWDRDSRDDDLRTYRLHFGAVPTAPGDLPSAYFEQICASYEVWLNGQLIDVRGSLTEPRPTDCYEPALMVLPPALLKPADNQLDIRLAGQVLAEVASSERAGQLSAVRLGSHDALETLQRHTQRFNLNATQALATVAAVIGLSALALQALSQLPYLGYFGAASLGWAVLCGLLTGATLSLPPHWLELVICGLTPPVGVAGILFLMRYCGLRVVWLEVALMLQCLMVPASLALAGAARVHSLAQPWSLILVIELAGALAVFLQRAWRYSRPDFWIGLAASAAFALTLVGELLLRPGPLLLPGKHAVSVAIIVLFAGLIWRMHQLFQGAVAGAEQGRRAAEQRVIDISASMEQNYGQMAELRVEQVTTRERKRIAADLHDDLGAKLLTIVHTSDNERIATLGREALEEMRLSVRGLTGRAMQIGDAIGDWRSELMTRFSNGGVELVWNAPDELLMSERAMSARAYVQTTRILREAVSNVLKHSGASRCEVSIRQDHSDFELTIADNGKGIPMELDGKLDRGHGMSTMKGRAKQLQGQCLVESGPGYGTTIRLTLPL